MTSVTLTTADAPGAVALIQLHGRGAADVLQRLTHRTIPADGRLRLGNLDGIDEGLVVAWGDDWAQVMPHGGPRVVALLLNRLRELGVTYDPAPDTRRLYPEAGSAIEADTLATIARAASPAAIDLLAAQPRLWRHRLTHSIPHVTGFRPHLEGLITPPTVVVVGRPNVGKSTLANTMMGRAVSLVSDLPGATRDWVGGLTELSGGIVVRWLDTPGLRESDDPVEQRAIALARRVVAEADVLIAMRDAATDWPLDLPRQADLWVVNKCDGRTVEAEPRMDMRGLAVSRDHPLKISAERDIHLDALRQAIVARLGLDALSPATLWAFSPTLRRVVETGDIQALREYTRAD